MVTYDASDHVKRAPDRAIELASNGSSLVVVSAARLAVLSRGSGFGAGFVGPIDVEWARGNFDKALDRLQENGTRRRPRLGHPSSATFAVPRSAAE